MKAIYFVVAFALAGCGTATDPIGDPSQTLSAAREGFSTRIVRSDPPAGPVDAPVGRDLESVHYPSPIGSLAAYVTVDPEDGREHPAIVWITGGDSNSIGDVWSPMDRGNDQSARAFREAGIVTMYPSQRGGNENPGQREGFYGEVDDILAAADYLAGLPYVDPDRIYLGGHSTGATVAMLVGEYSDRFRAVFALGPVSMADHYGGDFLYCDPDDEREVALRSPLFWLHGVTVPMYVFEGASQGNWDSIQFMEEQNQNALIRFFKVSGHDHFSVIAPLTERLAEQIARGDVDVTEATVRGLR